MLCSIITTNIQINKNGEIQMSKICDLLREMMKDEKKAPSDYEKIKVKMFGKPKNKKIISEIQNDERDHYKKVLLMAEELGCKCDK